MDDQLIPTGYSSLGERKSTGAHYTPALLAGFVAKQIVTAWSREKDRHEPFRILDPASGDGELLLALIKELQKKSRSAVKAFGYDTDDSAISLAISRVKKLFPEVPLELQCGNFLDFILLNGDGPLFRLSHEELYDLVIANPPYVRTQVLGAKESQKLSKQFGLSGRVDLYFPFILGISRVLRPGGIAGIIVSNRFMTTKAGSSVRQSILENFEVLHVWDLGDTRLFEAAVLPAVLLVRKKGDNSSNTETKFTSIYTTNDTSATKICLNAIDALNETGIVQLFDGQYYHVQQGRLEHDNKLQGVWRIANVTVDTWLSKVEEHSMYTFGDIGKIRVGVKTTADNVFIRSDWEKLPDDERPELLQPLITHHIAHRFKAIELKPEKKILYTHEIVNGKRVAIDISKYPRTEKYLNHHRSILEKREYLIEARRQWYEVWVPQDPAAWLRPKIVFKDISETPTCWMDLSGSIVNGDCYWLACDDPKKFDVLWLALAVGNSSFIQVYYDRKFHNKLYSSRRRFMTQYVEGFPMPNPQTDLSKTIVRKTKEIFNILPNNDFEIFEKELDELVWKAFGFSVEEIPR